MKWKHESKKESKSKGKQKQNINEDMDNEDLNDRFEQSESGEP